MLLYNVPMSRHRLASLLLLCALALLPSLPAQPAAPASGLCSDRAVTVAAPLAKAWNGWSPSITNTRFQNSGAAGLTIDQVSRLKLKWAFGFDGDMIVFSLPSIIGNNQ